jgi:capsular polysaccharide biosynthesis protein
MARDLPPSDDPLTPPHPAGGWSGSLSVVKDAVINHVNQGYLVHPSGIFDAEGRYLPQGVHWRGRALMTPPPFPEAVEPLAGRWLWAGVRMDHFGHFIMESLGRLWALDRSSVDGLLFIPEGGFRPETSPELAGWQRHFLSLLQVDLPVKLLTRATRVQELVVPGQGFGIGPLIGGTRDFRAFVQGRFAKDIPAEGPSKLYLSRSKLAADLGGIIREDQLEQDLAGQGYKVFHPQEHGLEAQIAAYKAATHVVSLDGSALHLFALVARADQRVAVIKRRPGSAPQGIVDHLTGFTGQSPLVVDVIRRNWMRSDRKKADNFSYGELDFQRLGRILTRQGFLPEGAALQGLPPRRAEAFIADLQKGLQRKGLQFLPMAPDGKSPATEIVPVRRLARAASKL